MILRREKIISYRLQVSGNRLQVFARRFVAPPQMRQNGQPLHPRPYDTAIEPVRHHLTPET